LHPLKKSIATLESQTSTLADCYLGLARLGAAIKKLPKNDHREFRQNCVAIFNRRFIEFDDDAYLLCFFLHPGINSKLMEYLKNNLIILIFIILNIFIFLFRSSVNTRYISSYSFSS
jgi:hypothetical protein